jgi:abortive infection bacteriophage resistance protein
MSPFGRHDGVFFYDWERNGLGAAPPRPIHSSRSFQWVPSFRELRTKGNAKLSKSLRLGKFIKKSKKYFADSNIVCTFAAPVPAKPLNNAQIGGSFYIYIVMKVNYTKTCTLPKDLIPLLQNRGLQVADEQQAASYLTNIGYFRLSAYCYPLLKEPKTDHLYKDDATFDLVMNMYRFDRKLRILLFNEIEKIEVAIRSAMTNKISHELNDVFWMTNPAYFHNQNIFSKTLTFIQAEMDKTKEEFIVHFRHKYVNAYPPAWMIAEIIPLGVLYNIYNNLNRKSIKKKVAIHFGLSVTVFSSWMMILSNLRNLCGHHVRVWNKEISFVPADLQTPVYPWIDSSTTDMKRIYYRICMIKYLLFTVSPNNRFTQKLKSLLAEYPTIDVKAMGFPAAWQSESLWQ